MALPLAARYDPRGDNRPRLSGRAQLDDGGRTVRVNPSVKWSSVRRNLLSFAELDSREWLSPRGLGKRNQCLQHVVQFVGVAHIGPGFFATWAIAAGSRWPTSSSTDSGRMRAHLDRTGPPFLERSVVEIRVRIRIQDLVREVRWDRRIHGEATDAPLANAAQQGLEAVDIHRLGEDVFHYFVDQGMIGDLDVALDIFLAGGRVGEHGREQIVASACAESAAELFSRPENAAAPASDWRPSASAYRKIGDIERGLLENVLHGFRVAGN